MPYGHSGYVSGMDRRTIYETPYSGARYSEKGNLVVENHVTGRETVYTRDGRVINEHDAREPYYTPYRPYHNDYYRPNYNNNNSYRPYYRDNRPAVIVRF